MTAIFQPALGCRTVTAYHVTSLAAWEGIQRDGVMRRYALAVEEYDSYVTLLSRVGCSNEIIWLWPTRPRGFELFGIVVDRIVHKHTLDVVLLTVRLQAGEYLGPSFEVPTGESAFFTHRGVVQHSRGSEWCYHDAAPVMLGIVDLPADRLTLVERYSALNLVRPVRL